MSTPFLCSRCHTTFRSHAPRADAATGFLCPACWVPTPPGALYAPDPPFDYGASLVAALLGQRQCSPPWCPAAGAVTLAPTPPGREDTP